MTFLGEEVEGVLTTQKILGELLSTPNFMPTTAAEMYPCLHVNYPLFLSDFNEDWNVSTNVNETYHYQI
jgi:hypothetical protein